MAIIIDKGKKNRRSTFSTVIVTFVISLALFAFIKHNADLEEKVPVKVEVLNIDKYYYELRKIDEDLDFKILKDRIDKSLTKGSVEVVNIDKKVYERGRPALVLFAIVLFFVFIGICLKETINLIKTRL